MNNPIAWVEIPVTEMDRAIDFYQKVFGWELSPNIMGETTMTFLPMTAEGIGIGGALVKHAGLYHPSDKEGTLVYFSNQEIPATLRLIAASGGEVLQEEKEIGNGSSIGLFLDCEGNRLALYNTGD